MVELIDNIFILYIILLGDKMYIEDQKTELKVELTKDIKKKLLHLLILMMVLFILALMTVEMLLA